MSWIRGVDRHHRQLTADETEGKVGSYLGDAATVFPYGTILVANNGAVVKVIDTFPSIVDYIEQPFPPKVVLPPTGITVTGFFDPPGRVELSWSDNVANTRPAISYNIIREGELTINQVGTTYSDTRNLVADAAYTFKIEIVNDEGISPPSSPQNVAIPNLTLWSAPTALTFTMLTNSTMNIGWTAPIATVGSFPIATYRVYRDGLIHGNTADTSTSLVVTSAQGLANWQVSVIDTDGNECTLSPTLIFDFTPVPEVPVNVRLGTWVSGTQIAIAWDAGPAGTFPTVDYALFRDGNPRVASGGGLTATDTATLGTSYSWTVRSIDNQGNQSVDSAAYVAEFLPRQPTSH